MPVEPSQMPEPLQGRWRSCSETPVAAGGALAAKTGPRGHARDEQLAPVNPGPHTQSPSMVHVPRQLPGHCAKEGGNMSERAKAKSARISASAAWDVLKLCVASPTATRTQTRLHA
jgi:hypothetical protein